MDVVMPDPLVVPGAGQPLADLAPIVSAWGRGAMGQAGPGAGGGQPIPRTGRSSTVNIRPEHGGGRDGRPSWITRDAPPGGRRRVGAPKAPAEAAQATPCPAPAIFAGNLADVALAIPNDASRRGGGAGRRRGCGAGGDLVIDRHLTGKPGRRRWRVRADGVVALRVGMLNNEWDASVGPALTIQKSTG